MKLFSNNNDKEILELKKRIQALEAKITSMEGSPIGRAAKFTEDAMSGKLWKY